MQLFEQAKSWLQPKIRLVKDRAQEIACGSPIYNWALATKLEHRFLVSLSDVWPGDSGRGRWLCNNVLDHQGALFQSSESIWVKRKDSVAHWRAQQSFDWLRDLKALGGDIGRKQARSMILGWVERDGKWSPESWNAGLTGQRLSNWIGLYEFFGASADEHFQHQFFDSLGRQFKHICRIASLDTRAGEDALASLYVAKGLIYGGIALQGQEARIEQGLAILKTYTPKLILSDGGYVTRSPADLVEAIMILLDTRAALKAGNYPVHPTIEQALDRALPAMRFFRYVDRRMAVFHGTQEGSEALLSLIIKRAGVRGKSCSRLPETGFERISQGKTRIMFDTGRTPSNGYDRLLHAAPLAFEMTRGKHRIIVNCGTHPADSDWVYALRSTPAHTALTLDDRNAYEIKESGHIGRTNTLTHGCKRKDMGQAAFAESAHNGYYTLNGVTHKRRLYLAEDGEDFRGEDILTRDFESGRAHHYAVRFHLHPSVKVSLVREGTEALIRVPSGEGWRFFHRGGGLALEESVYLGRGASSRKTMQIVLTGPLTGLETAIRWAFQKEG